MVIRDCYPIIVTEKLSACRDFYETYFRLQVGFESTWFLYLTASDSGKASLAFMHPTHPSAPPGPEAFAGTGMCLEFEVEDAAATHRAFLVAGAPITYPLTDEPFGQRRFGLHDPTGVWIDVVEQIEPQPGYWDKYMI